MEALREAERAYQLPRVMNASVQVGALLQGGGGGAERAYQLPRVMNASVQVGALGPAGGGI